MNIFADSTTSSSIQRCNMQRCLGISQQIFVSAVCFNAFKLQALISHAQGTPRVSIRGLKDCLILIYGALQYKMFKIVFISFVMCSSYVSQFIKDYHTF